MGGLFGIICMVRVYFSRLRSDLRMDKSVIVKSSDGQEFYSKSMPQKTITESGNQ